jgi:ATP-dependent helicase/nuclease subunit B
LDLLVYPTARAIRNEINSIEDSSFLPSILSIDEFFKKSISVDKYTFIDEEQRFLALKEVILDEESSQLGFSSDFIEFLRYSEYIFRFFTEISNELIDIDILKQSDTYELYSKHLDILSTIHKRYIEFLKKDFYVDRILLPSLYEVNNSYLNQFSNIEIFFEGYFSKFEFELINKIAINSRVLLHIKTNRYNEKSWQLFNDIGFLLHSGFEYTLDLKDKDIVSKESIIKTNPNIHIVGFNTRINQIAYIKTSIVNMISNGIKPSNIVVVVPDESFKNMLELFDDEEYFNYAMGKSIYNRLLFKCLNSIYLYLNDDDEKSIKLLEFLDIDIEFINKEFKKVFNNILYKDVFDKLIDYIRTKESNKELCEKFDEVVYRLNRLFFTTNSKILFKDAYKIIIQKISSITLDDINSGSITVMGLLETRFIAFDGVIIVDFNEDIVPKRSIKDKFISTIVKQNASLPTLYDRQNLQKYYYEQLIFKASSVYISYINNENNQISRFARELFDDYKISNKTQDQFYEHILYNKYKLNHFDENIIEKIDLSKKSWSASSLKSFLSCKRQYYFKYILKLKDHYFSKKPQNFEIGTIIHNILEKFYEDERVFLSDYHSRLNNLFDEQKLKNPFLILDLELYRKRFISFLQLEKNRFDRGIKVIDVEKNFNIYHRGINLIGKIDRIDKNGNIYEIIDYKTSSNVQVDTIKNYNKSVDFQLELYFLALKKELEDDSILLPYYYDLNNLKLLEEKVLHQKLELLNDILDTLHTKEVNFIKCINSTLCLNCSYKTICNR